MPGFSNSADGGRGVAVSASSAAVEAVGAADGGVLGSASAYIAHLALFERGCQCGGGEEGCSEKLELHFDGCCLRVVLC